ncbi:unnamed protein product [Protopolystoma xenopodis]|uniref:Uncharacterized protein n=1 Tax=Protopolystoma xenopodis TaxID=117903 RepID=A0A3S5CDH2_9PLAT|nr:unnamed protein product [Protopolystoma xenopodis]
MSYIVEPGVLGVEISPNRTFIDGSPSCSYFPVSNHFGVYSCTLFEKERFFLNPYSPSHTDLRLARPGRGGVLQVAVGRRDEFQDNEFTSVSSVLSKSLDNTNHLKPGRVLILAVVEIMAKG